MKIGFIGLGLMGNPMVKNLLTAGHEVVVFDIIQQCVDIAVQNGAEAAVSSKAVAEQCRVIITMLPNGPDVTAVVMGKNGVLEGAAEGSILVDMSSIAPGVSQEIERVCAEKGIRMIDAPVSGGVPKAIDGSLSIMVGGKQTDFEEVYEILMVMGGSAVLCGDIGAGNTTKLANQIIVAINIMAVSEAFMLSTRAGVDPEKVFDAIKGGLAGSTVMNAKIPMIMDNDFEPGFKIDLHIKDLDNALSTARQMESPVPLTELAMEVLQQLRTKGYGQKDHSAIVRYYENLTGTDIRR
jgi:2-hydroxy-3-oxopropionate reductase